VSRLAREADQVVREGDQTASYRSHTAAALLERIADPRAAPALRNLVAGRDGRARYAALISLSRAGDEGDVKAVT